MKTNAFSPRCHVILGLLTKIAELGKKIKKGIKHINEFQAEYVSWWCWLAEHYGNRALYINQVFVLLYLTRVLTAWIKMVSFFFTSQKAVYLI